MNLTCHNCGNNIEVDIACVLEYGEADVMCRECEQYTSTAELKDKVLFAVLNRLDKMAEIDGLITVTEELEGGLYD